MNPCVWMVMTAYRRPEMVRRALASLRDQGPALAGVLLVNNGGEPDMAGLVASAAPVIAKVITPRDNLGTAGGIAAGLQAGLAEGAATHFWIMDDDVVATPGALPALLSAMTTARAAAVSSLLVGETGTVAWFPGPLTQPAWDLVRHGVKPAELVARCGPTPLRWNWATWASLLVSRQAVETVGLPDARLWYQATDIEYTLRLSARFPCVLAPEAVCAHLPPPEAPAWRRIKSLWSLQSGAYIATRLRHGRRILRHLPGNHFRYWRAQHYSPRALGESGLAFWQGAVCGRPANREDFDRARNG